MNHNDCKTYTTMANHQNKESQQESQAITIGTQGNQDITVPQGTKGSHRSKEGLDDRHIPNQDHSSAANQEKADRDKRQD